LIVAVSAAKLLAIAALRLSAGISALSPAKWSTGAPINFQSSRSFLDMLPPNSTGSACGFQAGEHIGAKSALASN
jgi:hypothetical protein